MKKNTLKVMDKLDIDEGIRPLIRQLWKHCYITFLSCEGWRNGYNDESKGKHHSASAYVVFREGSGDGWFEENASKYGLEPHKNELAEIKDFKKMAGWKWAKLPELRVGDTLTVSYSQKEERFVKCYAYYGRKLIPNPFTPKKYLEKKIEGT